jgi:hypothetical protein
MATTKSLLLYYVHRIPLSDVLLNYGTRYNAKEREPLLLLVP